MKLYAHHLAKYDPEDIRLVFGRVATRKRAEGETAFPSLGDLCEPLDSLTRQRKAVEREKRQRQDDVATFWQWAPEWMAKTGNDEAELFRRYPSMRGTRPQEQEKKGAA